MQKTTPIDANNANHPMSANRRSLSEWLFLLEHRHAEVVQLGLARIRTVAERLDLCEWDVPVITVAGTNGKGSTVAALEAIYRSAGYRVGCYTSPHLLAFNERICVNHVPIDDETLCEVFSVIEHVRRDTHLTYFEMATLAALYYFKQSALDVVILEVGVGGRLDATNIIDADLAVITTIDFDHQAYLGNTLDAIGREKAGILRPRQWFVYADVAPPASIMNAADAMNIQAMRLGQEYAYEASDDALSITLPMGHRVVLTRPTLHLNAAVAAIVASHLLQSRLPVTILQWNEAMQMVSLPGRQQYEPGDVPVLFDVAHNPQSVLLLASWLQQLQQTGRITGRIHAVFSGLMDKDLNGLVAPLLPLVDEWYLAALTGPRAASRAQLKGVLLELANREMPCYDHPMEAFYAATKQALSGDAILVYGSFLTVSAVMAARASTRRGV